MIWQLALVSCFSYQLKLPSKLFNCIKLFAQVRTSNLEVSNYSLPIKVNLDGTGQSERKLKYEIEISSSTKKLRKMLSLN